METGSIKIINVEGQTPSVEAELVDGNAWMPKWKIARMFNVFNQKIEMNLRSIFKSRLLLEQDVSYTYRYTDKGIEKQVIYYNLEVPVFLSYRIASPEARIFRQFIHSALREHLQGKESKENVKLIWFFREGRDCRLN
ncbi:MAG: hypothetical protein LBQ73_05370 [Tannerellaceae bacterium]|jgi:hypothetical protein|nr:hypothetical protein [Tannerellaceae bacterium]